MFAGTRKGIGTMLGRKRFHTDYTISTLWRVALDFHQESVQPLRKILGRVPDFLDGLADVSEVKIQVHGIEQRQAQQARHEPRRLAKIDQKKHSYAVDIAETFCGIGIIDDPHLSLVFFYERKEYFIIILLVHHFFFSRGWWEPRFLLQ